jgi:DNA-binding transcriptional LysR family regulator
MDYRDLVFLEVAKNLSITKAADSLYISQPAVTKHIKELEAKLRITLFKREGNRLKFTEAGKLLHFYLINIQEKYEELHYEIGRLKEDYQGKLRIAASYTISQYIIANALVDFNHRYPNVRICLYEGNTGESLQKLTSNRVDVALIGNTTTDVNLKYENFYREEIIVVTSSTSLYAQKNSLSEEDLLEIPFVMPEEGSGILEVVRSHFKENQPILDKLQKCVKIGSTETVKSFLAKFDGIAFVTKKAIEKEIQLKILKEIPLREKYIYRDLKIVVRQGHLTFIAELFKNFLLDYNL